MPQVTSVMFSLLLPFVNSSVPVPDSIATSNLTAKERIVGQWQSADPKQAAVLEFKKNGMLTMSVASLKIKGTFRFIDPRTMEIKVDVPGVDEAITQKINVRFTSNEMVTTDEKGKVERFRRKATSR